MHRSPSRRLALALGLALPLASSGAASADPRPWSDPPAKSGVKSEAASADGAKAASAPARDAASSGAPSEVKAVASRPDAPDAVGAGRRPAEAAGADAGRTGMSLQRSAGHARPEVRGAKPVRRLADTPAPSPVTPLAASPATPRATIEADRGPAPGTRAGAAQALAARYLAAVSGPGEAMLGASPRFYGAQVRFYGRATTLTALMAEKRGFVRRWPERHYEPRAFRTTCAPGGETCTVRALVAFRAASPARGAVSRGSTELVLDVSFAGSRPVIVAESGRVLRRGA